MGAKFKSKTHLNNTFFFFGAFFFCVWLQSLKKVLLWSKTIFLEKLKKVSRNAEIHADFKSVEKVFKKFTKQVWRTGVQVEKVHISFTFLIITFFVHFFKTFSMDLKSGWNSAFFYTRTEFLKKIFFSLSLAFFLNFECKWDGSKKETYKRILEFS
jgi:hypothetical protein